MKLKLFWTHVYKDRGPGKNFRNLIIKNPRISGLLMIVKISILHFPVRIYGLNPELIGISCGQSRA